GGSGGSVAVQYVQNFVFGPLAASPPVIAQDLSPVLTQPEGLPMNLVTKFTGSTPLYYQWYFNGTKLVNNSRISGAASNILDLAHALTNDAGDYQVIASNFYGTATSSVVAVTVTNIIQIGDGTGWSLNSGATVPSFDTLQVADGNYLEVMNAFLYSPVNIDA